MSTQEWIENNEDAALDVLHKLLDDPDRLPDLFSDIAERIKGNDLSTPVNCPSSFQKLIRDFHTACGDEADDAEPTPAELAEQQREQDELRFEYERALSHS